MVLLWLAELQNGVPKISCPNPQTCDYAALSPLWLWRITRQKGFWDVIKAANQLTSSSSKGRLSGQAHSNHMSPWKAESFLWQVAEGEVREIHHVRRAHWKIMFCCWRRGHLVKTRERPLGVQSAAPLADGQHDGKDPGLSLLACGRGGGGGLFPSKVQPQKAVSSHSRSWVVTSKSSRETGSQGFTQWWGEKQTRAGEREGWDPTPWSSPLPRPGNTQPLDLPDTTTPLGQFCLLLKLSLVSTSLGGNVFYPIQHLLL